MLKNLKIKYKLGLLVLVLLLFIGAVGWSGVRALSQANDTLATIYNDRIVCLGQLKHVRDAYSLQIINSVTGLASGDLSYETARKNIESGQKKAQEEWTAYTSTYLIPEEKEVADKVTALIDRSKEPLQQLLRMIERQQKNDIIKFSDNELHDHLSPLIPQLSALSEMQIRISKELYDAQEIAVQKTHNLMLGLIVFAILLGGALAWYIFVSITRPMAYASAAINRMAQGDLSQQIDDSGQRDETGDIIRSTASIARTLQAVSTDLGEQINAARDGLLSVRADPQRHQGQFAELVSGVNELMAILSAPMQEIAGVMARLASGDIRGRMTGEYAGELQALKGNVNRSLDALVSLLDAISAFSISLAKGDLTYNIEGNFQGEFAAIRQNLNAAVAQLRNVLNNVIEATGNVAVSSQQTTAASSEVSKHAGNQMKTLLEVSGAIEQTVAAIAEIARSAERGSELARKASGAAQTGKSTLDHLTLTVDGIAEKNKRITQFSDLIANIADKTYVLAINAGLEAARAGEHGSGFGLISKKITSLAEEVADATRSIRQLIDETSTSVQQGLQGSAQAQASIETIVDLSQQNGMTVQAIAASIEEQSSMMGVLKERVNELKMVGQTTASASEEISVTMRSLEQITRQLKAETDRIRTA